MGRTYPAPLKDKRTFRANKELPEKSSLKQRLPVVHCGIRTADCSRGSVTHHGKNPEGVAQKEDSSPHRGGSSFENATSGK